MSVFSPIKICCCHSESPKDIKLFEGLRDHLATLIHSEQIILWHPGDLLPGDDREVETAFQLAISDIVLLLQSPDFLCSKSCLMQEGFALTLHHQRQTCIIPVLIRTSDWEHSPIFQLEPLPHNRKSIASSHGDKREQLLLDIVLCIRSEVERLYKVPRKKDYVPQERCTSFIFPPGLRRISVDDLQRIGHFLPTSGLTVHGKYRISGLASKRGEEILHHFPLGIPGYTPVSASISTDTYILKNLTPPIVTRISTGNIILWCNATETNRPYEAIGDIVLCY